MPRFYDGEKTVGSLPKPVPLKTKEEQEQEAEFNDLLLQLREYARVVREKVQVSEVNQAYEVDTEAFAALALLFQSVANADEYVNKLVAAESPEPQIKAESHEEVRR